MKQIFQFELSVIATIGEKIRHPVKDFVLNLPNVKEFTLMRSLQQQTFEKIISLIF